MSKQSYPAFVEILKLGKKTPASVKEGDRRVALRGGNGRFGPFLIVEVLGEPVFFSPKNVRFIPAKELDETERMELKRAAEGEDGNFYPVNAVVDRVSDSGKAKLLDFRGIKKWVPCSALKEGPDGIKVAKWFADKNGIAAYKAEPLNPEAIVQAIAESGDEKRAAILEAIKNVLAQ